MQLLETTKESNKIETEVISNYTDIPTVYQEVLDFLIKGPTPE